MDGANDRPRVSVVIPVHNAAITLARCLQALQQTTYEPWEAIVVDDGSADDSAGIAAVHQVCVLPSEGPARGPARARNRGARQARGPILIFLDADVAVRPGTIGRLVNILQQTPRVAACFGSYDAQPAAANFLSQYKNLLHHATHQNGRPEAMTFWAGCGAVYRDVFWDAGGFDESFAAPSVEDIELGLRLRALGCRIRLAPEIQVTHLKRWDARSLLRSDIMQRALPWSQLIMRQRALPDDLNLAHGQRASAVAAWALLVSLSLVPFSGRAGGLALFSTAALLAFNARFYLFLVRVRSLRFALCALPWHWLYFLYSSAVFAVVWLRAMLQRPR